jgi:DNA-binding transcriptional ArsR family regulator
MMCLVITEDAIFKVLAHPARRKIIAMLAQQNRSVQQLTRVFAMSQPAVSQHLRALKKAKIAKSQKVGMEQVYRLTAQPLRRVYDWSAQYKQFFDPGGHAWAFVSLPQATAAAEKHSRRRKRKHGR